MDSFPNCSISTFCGDKGGLWLQAVVFSCATNSKKDLIPLKVLAGVVKGNLVYQVREYDHFGSLEQEDMFLEFLSQYDCFGEPHKLCSAGSTYKCTWDPNTALSFVVEWEILDFVDLLHI